MKEDNQTLLFPVIRELLRVIFGPTYFNDCHAIGKNFFLNQA